MRKALLSNPDNLPSYRVLVAANALLGRMGDARAAAEQLLRRQPSFTVTGWVEAAPLKMTPGQKRMIAAMIEGGLPE